MGQREIAIRREAATPDLKIAKEGGLLFERIFKTDPGVTIVSSSPKIFSAIHPDDFTENFYLSEVELKSYIKGFVKAVKEFGKETAEKTAKNSAEILDDTSLDDKDVKLSLYRSFKSLYDKWISSSEQSNNTSLGYFFNDYGQADDRFLFDHFKFINRINQEIGGKAAIDPAYLSTLANSDNGQGGPKQSLYQVVTGLLSENNFDFWPTPANIDLTLTTTSDEDLKDMFRPLDFVSRLSPGPLFNCVYTAGSSRFLKDLNNREGGCQLINDFNYNDDSFDISEKSDWPDEFKSSDEKGVVAFKVRYGQEAQNHFTTLQLDQTEFKETQESLKIIDALANPRQGNSPATAGKGNNMFDVYLTRSYNCTVTGLGNMSIQPMMYFKLENVPMFRGTYFVNNVKHTITPHNVKTEFTGLRQPRITIPVVEDPISLLDLALSNESAEGPPGTLGTGTQQFDYNESTITTFDSIDDCVATSLDSVTNDGSFPIIIKGCYTAKDMTSSGDALHSFNTRSSDKFGGYMFDESAVPGNFSGRVKVGTQGGVYAGKGTNAVLKELNSNGIKTKVSKIEINIDWSKYFVSWSVTIDKSSDGKSYIGVATRGSFGDIAAGTYSKRADDQIPVLKTKNPEYSNWTAPTIVYNGKVMSSGYLEDPQKKLRQYFLAYTKA